MKSSTGAVVTQVTLHSPAEQAGLQIGDVINAVNGSEIKTANDVVNAVGFMRVDSKANISVLRKDKSISVSAILSDPKKRAQDNEALDPFFFGVSLKDFTLLSPVHGDIKGVLVVSVEDDTNAWHSDLRPGDVITSINQQKITSITELKKIAAASKEDLLLNVLRGPGAVFLVISKQS